ncbi:MAG: YicC/YloC family endoribonuclease [Clostridia bacterium]
MKSMTGYGKGIVENQDRKLTIELKAVNHRFLDLNFKMPKSFSFAEDIIRKQIQTSVTRGHLDIYINYQDLRAEKTNFKIDYALAKKYIEVANALSEQNNINNDFSVSSLMKIPDVVVFDETEEDEDVLLNLLKATLDEALKNIMQMKTIEGGMIKDDLLKKVAEIKATVDVVNAKAPLVIAEHKEKLVDKLREAVGENYDEQRILTEITIFADKIGIDEELLRLYSHIKHFCSIIKEEEIVGKKLDFIVQEMNRETNTIGSKCNDIEISNCVVMLKNEIEKIREQVQNIE